MFKKAIRGLINRVFTEVDLHTDDYALGLLNASLSDYYIPFTISSLRPYELVTVINDILVNGRGTIVEFGSGASTLVIADILMKNNLPGKLYSIEEDPEWAATLSTILAQRGLSEKVEVIPAPLKVYKNEAVPFPIHYWYDTEKVQQGLSSVGSIDCILVDGPKLHNPSFVHDRAPAVYECSHKLGERFSVFLDDVGRKGERQILQAWSKQLKSPYAIKSKDLGIITQGSAFEFYIR